MKDASFQGLEALLSQYHGVIAYASRGLRPTETNDANYSSMNLEVLDLKCDITDKFRHYLTGSPFIIYTTNNPLRYIQTSMLRATESRLVAQIAQFDLSSNYRTGQLNTNADALGLETLHGYPVIAEGESQSEQLEMTEFVVEK